MSDIPYEIEREQRITCNNLYLTQLGIDPVAVPKPNIAKPKSKQRPKRIKKPVDRARVQPQRTCNVDEPAYKDIIEAKKRPPKTRMMPIKETMTPDQAFHNLKLEDLRVFDDNEKEQYDLVSTQMGIHFLTLKGVYAKVVRVRKETESIENQFKIVISELERQTKIPELLCEALLTSVLEYEKKLKPEW
jgi:hypothetical protein